MLLRLKLAKKLLLCLLIFSSSITLSSTCIEKYRSKAKNKLGIKNNYYKPLKWIENIENKHIFHRKYSTKLLKKNHNIFKNYWKKSNDPKIDLEFKKIASISQNDLEELVDYLTKYKILCQPKLLTKKEIRENFPQHLHKVLDYWEENLKKLAENFDHYVVKLDDEIKEVSKKIQTNWNYEEVETKIEHASQFLIDNEEKRTDWESAQKAKNELESQFTKLKNNESVEVYSHDRDYSVKSIGSRRLWEFTKNKLKYYEQFDFISFQIANVRILEHLEKVQKYFDNEVTKPQIMSLYFEKRDWKLARKNVHYNLDELHRILVLLKKNDFMVDRVEKLKLYIEKIKNKENQFQETKKELESLYKSLSSDWKSLAAEYDKVKKEISDLITATKKDQLKIENFVNEIKKEVTKANGTYQSSLTESLLDREKRGKLLYHLKSLIKKYNNLEIEGVLVNYLPIVGNNKSEKIDEIVRWINSWDKSCQWNQIKINKDKKVDDISGSCSICLDDYDDREIIKINLSCGDSFCKNCIEDHIYTSYDNHQALIKCPQPDCSMPAKITIDEAKKGGIDEHLFFLIELFVVDKFLNSRKKEFVPCSNMKCGNFFPISEEILKEKDQVTCGFCKTNTCLKCKQKFGKEAHICDQEVLENMRLADEKMRQDGFMDCPYCGTWAERTEGCNKVACQTCGNIFDFVTGGPWTKESVDRIQANHGARYYTDYIATGSQLRKVKKDKSLIKDRGVVKWDTRYKK